MIRIDHAKCTGCGECAKDCDGTLLVFENGAPAFAQDGRCYECGHCIAVCPAGAVSDVDAGAMREVAELSSLPHMLDADTLLGAIKARRSIRRFKQQPVELEKLNAIIEAGRYTPTASNRQGNSYVVVTRRVEELRRLIVDSLAALAYDIPENATDTQRRYAEYYLYMHDNFEQDMLFFNAPAVIFLLSDDVCDGALAASNMELMAYAQGLGMVYCGFATRGVNASEPARAFLNIPEDKLASVCLVTGYPDVT